MGWERDSRPGLQQAGCHAALRSTQHSTTQTSQAHAHTQTAAAATAAPELLKTRVLRVRNAQQRDAALGPPLRLRGLLNSTRKPWVCRNCGGGALGAPLLRGPLVGLEGPASGADGNHAAPGGARNALRQRGLCQLVTHAQHMDLHGGEARTSNAKCLGCVCGWVCCCECADAQQQGDGRGCCTAEAS